MLYFICLFFPAFLSVKLFEMLSRSELSFKDCLLRWGCNTLLINFFCLAVKKFILQTSALPMYTENDILPSTAFNYLVIAIVGAVGLTILEILFSKNISIEVKEENSSVEAP